jgi:hypothetical protein
MRVHCIDRSVLTLIIGVQVIFSANAHTARKLENPMYAALGAFLPSYREGQGHIKAFHKVMKQILEEVRFTERDSAYNFDRHKSPVLPAGESWVAARQSSLRPHCSRSVVGVVYLHVVVTLSACRNAI